MEPAHSTPPPQEAPRLAPQPSPVEASIPVPPVGFWAKTKHLVGHNILHLDDTPHRIALGVFLGFLVGMTPTIGMQMLIYLGIAAVCRANKVSGMLPVWLSNPVTAVPLYYTNWMIGCFILTGRFSASEETKRTIAELMGRQDEALGMFERLTSHEFWIAAFDTFVQMGLELWIGSLIVGIVTGVIGYWITFRAVTAIRAKRAALRAT